MDAAQFPKVVIIILNWNGRKWLAQFLPSVCATRYPNYEILVVDNGSTDDSLALLAEAFPAVRVLPLDQNYGFTEGNNKALPAVDAPYYVLLNSDVEVTPDWLTPLVALAETDSSIASIQPKLLAYHDKNAFEYAGGAGGYIDAFAYPFCRGRIFDVVEQDTQQYESVAEIFWATGACCLIRKSVTDEIGLFEPSFFAHMEEIDFCWRAKNCGYKIMYQPQSVVYHVGGGTLNKVNPFKTFLNVRNSISMMYLNYAPQERLRKIFVRLLLDGVWGAKSLLRGDFKTIGAILKAHFAFYGRISYLRQRRKAIYGTRPLPRSESHTGVYAQSIVWQYFAKGKKLFTELGQ